MFESQVIGHNRGGVICRVGKVRGFVPASQLVSKPEVAAGYRRREPLGRPGG